MNPFKYQLLYMCSYLICKLLYNDQCNNMLTLTVHMTPIVLCSLFACAGHREAGGGAASGFREVAGHSGKSQNQHPGRPQARGKCVYEKKHHYSFLEYYVRMFLGVCFPPLTSSCVSPAP